MTSTTCKFDFVIQHFPNHFKYHMPLRPRANPPTSPFRNGFSTIYV